MQSERALRNRLGNLDGRDYGACQSLKGAYAFPDFELYIDRIPKDPYAPPHTGIYRLRVTRGYTGIPVGMIDGGTARVACRDFLARRFSLAAGRIASGGRGTGYSGLITLDTPAQGILDRSAVILTDDGIEVRFFIGLPARGRKINAVLAETMLFEELPRIVEQGLRGLPVEGVRRFIETAENAEALREALDALGLVAFIADGAVLPRKSGTTDLPMERDNAVIFRSPESLRVSVDLPHAGKVTGMGIPKGVTLIVGGGFHGKSTLLHAAESGIYNHIPGDGRELCVSDALSVKVRAYSGRSVASVDISSFINNLPFGRDTVDFSTVNASGSTSQAAGIVEALEMGVRVLLMDEDTCAANFMIRDRNMQELVKETDEPITPFIDRVRRLYDERGVSSVLVSGGLGAYFEVADTVIQMLTYEPRDVTALAGDIAAASPARREQEHRGPCGQAKERFVHPQSIDPCNTYNKESVYAKEPYRIHFGRTEIDLTDLEQITELSQTKTIARALLYLKKRYREPVTVKQMADEYMRVVEENGLDGLSDSVSGHLARVRGLEVAFALNRLRGLKIEQR